MHHYYPLQGHGIARLKALPGAYNYLIIMDLFL